MSKLQLNHHQQGNEIKEGPGGGQNSWIESERQVNEQQTTRKVRRTVCHFGWVVEMCTGHNF